MADREEILQAIDILKRRRSRFGEEAVATSVAVLEELLAGSHSTTPLPRAAGPSHEQTTTDQRKQVSILFAAIDGFTRLAGSSHHTEQLRRIDQLWRRLDETIEEHGGLVDKHMGDVVMGFFGVPAARENDPERAVYCALAIREGVAEFFAEERNLSNHDSPKASPTVRIGINTGSVSLGRVGSDSGYTVIGDAVNVASRLRESAREGGIYISQETFRLVEPIFRVESLGDLTIKGRRTPVTVYRVVGQRPRLFFPGSEFMTGINVPMIGREAQIRHLWSAYETIFRTGQGSVMTIVGEIGVGKSRLMGEFHRYLETVPEKLAIFLGRTDQRLMEEPFSLLRDLLAHQFEITKSDRIITVQEKLATGLEVVVGEFAADDRGKQEMIQAVARLIGFEMPDEWVPGAIMTGADDRALVSDLLIRYFEKVAASSAVMVIFLEDIHWADDDSLDFFERVAALAAHWPIMLIATTRPPFFEQRPDWPENREGIAEQLVLPPLPEADSRALVFQILQKLPDKSPAIVDLVVRSAGGNPFYIEELIKVLIEDGILLPGEPNWRMRPLNLQRVRVPTTLTGVLQARLDRLSEVDRVILQQAAVMGDEFLDRAVWQVNQASRWSLPVEQFNAALQSLERRNMITRVPSPSFSGSQAFRFGHAMLREVTYESVLLRDRPVYHLQVARWLEAESGDRWPEYAARIAQHQELAGQLSAAASLYQVAARRAIEQSQAESAISHYRHALELLQQLPHELDESLEVQYRLGKLLQRDLRFVEGLQLFTEMSLAAELDGNLLRQAQAENALAGIYDEMGNDESALAAAETAEQVARLTDAELEFVRAIRQQAKTSIHLGRIDEAEAAASEAAARSRLLVTPHELAKSLELLHRIYRRAGDMSRSAPIVDELSALADTLVVRGLGAESGFVLGRLAALYTDGGFYESARGLLVQALDRQQPVAGRSEIAETLCQLGLVTARGGDPSQAMVYLDEATKLAEGAGNRYQRLVCRLAVGEVLLALGRFEAAEAALRQVIATAEDPQRMGGWREVGRANRLLMEALIRQGRGDEADQVGMKARLLAS